MPPGLEAVENSTDQWPTVARLIGHADDPERRGDFADDDASKNRGNLTGVPPDTTGRTAPHHPAYQAKVAANQDQNQVLEPPHRTILWSSFEKKTGPFRILPE